MTGSSHFTQHDQSRATGIDRTPLLQKVPRSREGVEDQNRLVENAEVIDVAFGQDKRSVDEMGWWIPVTNHTFVPSQRMLVLDCRS